MPVPPFIPHNHGDNMAEILARMPNGGAFAGAAEVFSQLCDPTRLRILWILCHSEECVTNIAAAIGMSDAAVSHHLRVLKTAGLAVGRRVGKEVHYTLPTGRVAGLCHRMIDDIFEVNCPNEPSEIRELQKGPFHAE